MSRTEHTGTSKGQSLFVEGGVRLPLFKAGSLFTWETRASLEARAETIETPAFAGESVFATLVFLLQTGFAWAP